MTKEERLKLVKKLLDEGKHFSEYTPEELKAFDSIPVLVQKVSPKKRQPFFQIQLKFGEDPTAFKTTVRNLTETQYKVMCLDFPKEHKRDGDEFVVVGKAFFTEGTYISKPGKWRKWHVGVGKSVFHHNFFRPEENRLINEYGIQLDYIKRDAIEKPSTF